MSHSMNGHASGSLSGHICPPMAAIPNAIECATGPPPRPQSTICGSEVDPQADRLSNRNSLDPLATTRHHSDSGSSRRRATNNTRQAAPALQQRRQRRSSRQLLRRRPRRVRGLARRRQCRRVRRQRSHPQPDLAPGVGVVVAAPSPLVVAVPSPPMVGQAALPLAPEALALNCLVRRTAI